MKAESGRLITTPTLRAELTLSVDKRHKGGVTLGHSRLSAIAADLVEDEENDDEYLIITNDGEEIRPGEIVLRTKTNIDSMGKSIQRDAAWESLLDYYNDLSKTGKPAQ